MVQKTIQKEVNWKYIAIFFIILSIILGSWYGYIYSYNKGFNDGYSTGEIDIIYRINNNVEIPVIQKTEEGNTLNWISLEDVCGGRG